jgi:transmembrane sensor
MKDYTNYSVEDFIIDDDFVRWVKSPDSESDAFWSDFLAANPAKHYEIDEAIQFLKMFSEEEALAPDTIAQLQQQITDRIDIPVSAATVHEIVRTRTRRTYTYAYAAVVSLILLVTAAWWQYSPGVAAQTEAPVSSLQEDYPAGPLMEHVVPKGVRSRITLADGTQVWLNADSRMQYSRDFMKGDIREVYLQGEAFFDVTSIHRPHSGCRDPRARHRI